MMLQHTLPHWRDSASPNVASELWARASSPAIRTCPNWADLTPEAKWTRKERWMDRIITDLDHQYPGIAGAIVQREMSTAETFHQYLNTPGGALYGFAPQSRGFVPLTETSIGGLYLASAFT